jgi:hypothetical protein
VERGPEFQGKAAARHFIERRIDGGENKIEAFIRRPVKLARCR